MKNIFKLLSGRPKYGNIIECIRPWSISFVFSMANRLGNEHREI